MDEQRPLKFTYSLKLPFLCNHVWQWHQRIFTTDRLMPPYLIYNINKRPISTEAKTSFIIKIWIFKWWPKLFSFTRSTSFVQRLP
jgi:hypothetical protein